MTVRLAAKKGTASHWQGCDLEVKPQTWRSKSVMARHHVETAQGNRSLVGEARLRQQPDTL